MYTSVCFICNTTCLHPQVLHVQWACKLGYKHRAQVFAVSQCDPVVYAAVQAYSVDVGGKLAGEDEAVDALLQAWNVHDLHKVAFNSAKLLRVIHSLVLRMLALYRQIA